MEEEKIGLDQENKDPNSGSDEYRHELPARGKKKRGDPGYVDAATARPGPRRRTEAPERGDDQGAEDGRSPTAKILVVLGEEAPVPAAPLTLDGCTYCPELVRTVRERCWPAGGASTLGRVRV